MLGHEWRNIMFRQVTCSFSQKSSGKAPAAKRGRQPAHVILATLALLLAAALAGQCIMLARPESLEAARARMAEAATSEQELFHGPGLTRIVNCYLFEISQSTDAPMAGWIPVVRQDGFGRISTEAIGAGEATCINDEIWFDPARGNYRRVLYEGLNPIFAMAFDGEWLYVYNPARQGGVTRERVAASFRAPEDPTELFGMMAGLPISFTALAGRRPDRAGKEQVREWGTLGVLEYSMPGRGGAEAGRWTLKVRERDRALIEIDYAEGGAARFMVCRGKAERRAEARVAWDLSDLGQAWD